MDPHAGLMEEIRRRGHRRRKQHGQQSVVHPRLRGIAAVIDPENGSRSRLWLPHSAAVSACASASVSASVEMTCDRFSGLSLLLLSVATGRSVYRAKELPSLLRDSGCPPGTQIETRHASNAVDPRDSNRIIGAPLALAPDAYPSPLPCRGEASRRRNACEQPPGRMA